MDVNFVAEDANSAARHYIESGMAVLPARPGEKVAKIEGWPNLIIGPEAVDEYFPPGKHTNIVRVNGTNSGGRGDIDLDRLEALKIASYMVPEDTLRFGRESKTPGHVEIKFADTVPRTAKYALPGDGADRMLVELRADGSQTLLPPSVYPEGDKCVWSGEDVLEAHAVTLHSLAADIAIGSLLLMDYPGEGARHEYWLGAVGMMLKARHPLERVRRIVEATTKSANDPEWRLRLDIIDRSETRRARGQRIAGKSKLGTVAPEVPQILEDFLGTGAITDSGLPHIVTNNRPLREVSDEATDALLAANDPPEIFARSGSLARLATDSEGRPVIQDVDKDRLRYHMTRTGEYLKVGDDIAHVYPPDAVVGDVAAAKAFAFPELVVITQSPALRPSGTILERPGYDPETRLIYSPSEDVKVDVPFEPSEADVAGAVALLREVYQDFPFVDEASLANMLALTITPIVRPAYPGPTPLAVIDKPSPGTGASLLSEVVCDVATAQGAAMMSPPDNDEETRKQITAVLRTGRPIIVIDNVPQGMELKNSSYSRALTSTLWEDRILGHSRVATLPNRATWITSGNNIKVGGDLPRRCYWIRMDAKLEFPADRPPEAFTHPDLRGWVSENRGALLSAILILARHWFAVGKPKWSGRPPGSFEGWARMVGGILETAGIPGFLGNTKKMRAKSATGVSEWAEFLAAWHAAYGETPIKAKDLIASLEESKFSDLKEALPAELAYPYAEGDLMLSRKFGEAFSKKEDVRHGSEGLRIEQQQQSGSSNKSAKWSVRKDGGHRGGGSGGQEGQPTSTPGDFGTKEHVDTEEYQDSTSTQNSPDTRLGDPSTSSQGDSGAKKHVGTEELQYVTNAQNLPGTRSTDPPDPLTPQDVAHAVVDITRVPAQEGTRDFTSVENTRSLDRLVKRLKKVDRLGADLETTSLDWWARDARVRLISLTTPAGDTYVVDAFKVDPAPLYRVLEDKHLVFHNAAFDVPYLRAAGCKLKSFECTRVLSQLRFAGFEFTGHDLEAVAKRHLPVGTEFVKNEVDHARWRDASRALTEKELAYAAGDSKHLLAIRDDLVEKVLASKAVAMSDVADLEMGLLKVVTDMSFTGMPVDPAKWDAVIVEAKERKAELVSYLDAFIPEDTEIPEGFVDANKGMAARGDAVGRINWNSHPQKLWVIEEVLGLEAPTKWNHKKKEQRPTLDKDHIHMLGHPIAELLLEYQAIMNFPATFEAAIEERCAAGWIHPDWLQLEARTGRMSCRKPPMMNIPRKSALREAIVAPAGYSIVTIDFSQIEPRVLAALSRDTALIKAFRDGLDIYRYIAAQVTGAHYDAIDPKGSLRSVFKTIVLGMAYGMSVFGLTLRIHKSIDPNMPEEQIRAYWTGFFDAFPGAKSWREEREAEFRKFPSGKAESRTLLGRRRLGIDTERQYWNVFIQGAACDAFKAAVVAVDERQEEAPAPFKIIALIHDEVVIVTPTAHAESIKSWAMPVMEEAAHEVVNGKLPERLAVPIVADGGVGGTLQEAKDAA